MCLILDKHFENWQTEYYSKKISLYNFFISKFQPQKTALEIDTLYYALAKFHSQQLVQEHRASLNKFNAQQGIKITLKFNKHPQFKGFDPMHAEAVNDSTILHTTMLSLSGNSHDKLFINNKDAVTIIDREIWFVNKVILFAPKENILIKKDRIVIGNGSENILWTGKLKMKTEREIVFICD